MRLSFNHKPIDVSVLLPASKSISNRLLILKKALQSHIEIKNISTSEDTVLLLKALDQINAGVNKVIDVHHAGTDMRFLTALLSTTPGEWIITGSERMKQRPIGILVDALRSLGADITYLEKDGFPPLKIRGTELKANSVEIDSGVSSQFVSALLLIAPSLEKGLTIRLTNKTVSTPYIQMTIDLMKQLGISVSKSSGQVAVARFKPQASQFRFSVEPDWSAASYWYSICALSKDSVIRLPGLKKDSLQGDSVLPDLYKSFGVSTEFGEEGVTLKNTGASVKEFEYDFISCPDIAQTIAVTCFALNIPAHLTGLSTLKNKETDRISALQTELEKCSADVLAENNSISIRTQPERIHGQLNTKHLKLKTYNDHRMAMAFAPLAMLLDEIEIDDPEVVVKSYPGFWRDLKTAGFECDYEM